jgi:hypothetical protein
VVLLLCGFSNEEWRAHQEFIGMSLEDKESRKIEQKLAELKKQVLANLNFPNLPHQSTHDGLSWARVDL